jgi:hypothetical protein
MMLIGNVITPFLHRGGGSGVYYSYTRGEYRFEAMDACNWHIRAHLEGGACRPDADDTISNAGTCTIISAPPASSWRPPPI